MHTLQVCSSDDKNIFISSSTLAGLYKVLKEVILMYNFKSIDAASCFEEF